MLTSHGYRKQCQGHLKENTDTEELQSEAKMSILPVPTQPTTTLKSYPVGPSLPLHECSSTGGCYIASALVQAAAIASALVQAAAIASALVQAAAIASALSTRGCYHSYRKVAIASGMLEVMYESSRTLMSMSYFPY